MQLLCAFRKKKNPPDLNLNAYDRISNQLYKDLLDPTPFRFKQQQQKKI